MNKLVPRKCKISQNRQNRAKQRKADRAPSRAPERRESFALTKRQIKKPKKHYKKKTVTKR
jgi:hypothetical protein